MLDTYTKLCSLSTTQPDQIPARLKLMAVVALLCVLLAACGASEPPKPTLKSEDPEMVLWPLAEKAIRLRISADKNLNSYESKAHSIQLCVYQLDKPDAFLKLAKTQDGIAQLLKAELFDKSVKDVVRLFMQPFEETSLDLDRAENATFVGIVCGYFDSTPANSAKVWEIKPQVTKSGILFKTTTFSAGALDLSLRLTPHAMMEDSGKRKPRREVEEPYGRDSKPASIAGKNTKAKSSKANDRVLGQPSAWIVVSDKAKPDETEEQDTAVIDTAEKDKAKDVKAKSDKAGDDKAGNNAAGKDKTGN